MLDHFPRPIVLAHRGDMAHAPENTLPSFQMAVQKGADGVELDAKLTADGHVIVIHDPTIDRTTDGSGRVALSTLESIRKLDAGSWFSDAFRGAQVPLLEEVFETVGRKKLINIELTNYSTPGDRLVQKVCELIRRHQVQDQILFSSFFAANLRKASRTLPEIPRALLAMPGLRGAWARSFGFMFGNYQALHPHISDANRQQVQRIHRLNRRMHVWTANSREEMNQLREWNADGIFTDDPQLALLALGRA
jgi:glycerophosphoryl diester phosphodiesterase